jgi:hypothetical protein
MSRILHKSWFCNVEFPDQLSDNWFLKKAYAQRSQAEVATVDWMCRGRFMKFLNAFIRCGCAFHTYSFLTWHTFRFLPFGCKPRFLIQCLVLLAAAWTTEVWSRRRHSFSHRTAVRLVLGLDRWRTWYLLNNQVWPVLETNTLVLVVTRLDFAWRVPPAAYKPS